MRLDDGDIRRRGVKWTRGAGPFARGQPIVYPRDDLSFAENFLYMMFALPTKPYALDPVAARCLVRFVGGVG